ncbi:MAG: dihydroorotase [Methanoculleaceae archaeon]
MDIPDLVLKHVILPDGRVADLSFSAGRLIHIGAAPPHAYETIDRSGCRCIPAAIDMHVHMRGGVQRRKEDWKTGTQSALAGGVTVVVDQPNTVPPIFTRSRFLERVDEARRLAYCKFAVNAGVAEGAELTAMWHAGAMAFGEVFVAPSSYGERVRRSDLRNALEQISALGGLVTIHAEDVTGEPDNSLSDHDRARSAAGEVRTIREMMDCAPQGCRLHFCHMSTADAVDAAGGTCEVTPHHLFLDIERFDPCDGRGKVNPPLRRASERKRLWERWERIDVIASDHAPHTLDEKRGPFEKVPAGIPGVETMLPLLLAAAESGRVSISSVIEKTSQTPARILRIPPPSFDRGGVTDFVIYRPEPGPLDPDRLHSKCGWSPYEGFPVIFPSIVVMDGRVAFRDGEFSPPAGRWIPGPGYRQSSLEWEG